MGNEEIYGYEIEPKPDTVIEQAASVAEEIKVTGKPLIHSKIFWIQVVALILSIAVMVGANIPEYYVGIVAAVMTIAFRYLNPDITGVVSK